MAPGQALLGVADILSHTEKVILPTFILFMLIFVFYFILCFFFDRFGFFRVHGFAFFSTCPFSGNL